LRYFSIEKLLYNFKIGQYNREKYGGYAAVNGIKHMYGKINIVIYDDEKNVSNSICRKIKRIADSENYPIEEIYIAEDTRDVFKYSDMNNCLCFLDVQLGEDHVDGIEIAQELKNRKNDVKIIFVSSYPENKVKALVEGTEALGFIEKNIMTIEDSLKHYLLLAIKRFGIDKTSKEIKVSVNISTDIFLKEEEIVYIDTDKSKKHWISYHLMNGKEIRVRDSMEQAYSILNNELFMFSSRGEIINKQHVRKVIKDKIEFVNGEQCTCSRKNIKEIKKLCRENTFL
jgi:DNA-binding LytR/AlgR family response regulator